MQGSDAKQIDVTSGQKSSSCWVMQGVLRLGCVSHPLLGAPQKTVIIVWFCLRVLTLQGSTVNNVPSECIEFTICYILPLAHRSKSMSCRTLWSEHVQFTICYCTIIMLVSDHICRRKLIASICELVH